MTERTAQRNKVIPFAATPVLLRDVAGKEEMNRKLTEIIMEMYGKMGSTSRTNVGGWQSPTNFLETLPKELMTEFLAVAWQGVLDIVVPMGAKVEGYQPRIAGWANVSMKGGLNVPHIHPNGAWSVVYYLAAGDAGKGGELHLMDPRVQAGMFASPLNPGTGELVYAPQSSSMIVFPSWLTHFVMPYMGESPRINIALNVA